MTDAMREMDAGQRRTVALLDAMGGIPGVHVEDGTWSAVGPHWKYTAGGACRVAFDPFADVEADYSVLVRVREAWIFSKRTAFAKALDAIWQERVPLSAGYKAAYPEACMRYQPGDYSRAALAALGTPPVGGQEK